MKDHLPIKRLIVCAAIALVAIGLGTFNVLYSNYVLIHEIIQGVLAAVGMTALGEVFASLSKHPKISYVICAVLCALALQAMTPWNIIIPRCDFYQVDKIIAGYQYAVLSCLVVYSLALAASILFGIFVLHKKDNSKSEE